MEVQKINPLAENAKIVQRSSKKFLKNKKQANKNPY